MVSDASLLLVQHVGLHLYFLSGVTLFGLAYL